jgi:23S rRNA (uracil1939-C5)-methyltransferase
MNKMASKSIQCSHFTFCSGCSVNEFVDNPPVFKEIEAFFKQNGVEVALHSGNVTGWRSRAKLAIRGTSNEPAIGLFHERSHQVVNIPFCKVHHPAINQAVKYVRQFIYENKIEPYNELTFQGDLRYIQIVVERASNKVQLSLVWNKMDDKKGLIQERVANLMKMGTLKENLPFWHSIWLNFNDRKDNVIFGEKWLLVYGEEFLWEKFGQTSVCFHPASFAQANLDLFELMLTKIKEEITEDDVVVEYYAGVGVIGLSLVEKCRGIQCCEVVLQAKKCFEKSLTKLDPLLAHKIRFQLGSVETKIDLLEQAHTVIVDPPRKGIHKALLKALQEMSSLKKIIYVSCGWEAFQRDCDALLSANWALTSAEAYLFFPGSNHMEILSIFIKKTL